MAKPKTQPIPFRGTLKQLAGRWVISGMDEFEVDYWEDEDDVGVEEACLVLHAPAGEWIQGEYEVECTAGNLEGVLREFGGEKVCIFGYDGVDDTDAECGGGWLRLTGPDTLDGEFVGGLGKFTAQRRKKKPAAKRRARQSARARRR